jgi:hypothetical protein
MEDYRTSFDTLEEAKAWVETEQASPRYPRLFGSTDPKDKWAQERMGKFDWYEIEDMDEYE